MPHFSRTSQDKLSTCCDRLQTLFNEVIKHYDCKITCGFRSIEDQQQKFEEFKSKVPGGKSKHNKKPSQAVDVLPWPFKPEDWTDTRRFFHFAGFVLATCKQMQRDGRLDASFDLVWGADWDGDYSRNSDAFREHSFLDCPHFEIRQFSERP